MSATLNQEIASQNSTPIAVKFQPSVSVYDLEALNRQFESTHPRDILAWCVDQISTGLVQVSAFNISGLVIMDILYQDLKPSPTIPVLFLDTLHHFRETLGLVLRAVDRYGLNLKVYQVLDVKTRADFANLYGDDLWEKNPDKFSQLTKVEPLQRGLKELGAIAWINGRRRDQSSTRVGIPIFELDKHHRLKVNPLASWTSDDIWAYVRQRQLIYNPLLDRGYTSIGDQPTTTPVKQGEDERAGRWRGSDRTECGIH